MEKVTIGFVPRERFSMAPRSLQSLLDHTHLPHHLIWVDCNTPERYRRQIEALLEDHPSAEVIRTENYLGSNAAKNRIVEHNQSEFLALVENDNLLSDGWLTHLLKACEEMPADVATPLLTEGGRVHFDRRFADLHTISTPEGDQLEFIARPGDWEEERTATRRFVRTLEMHVNLFRSSVFDKIGLFDERLTTRRELDLMAALYTHQIPIAFVPEAVTEYVGPPPVHPDERDFFRFIWDVDAAEASHHHLEQKWDFANLPYSLEFVQNRHHRISHLNFLKFRLGYRLKRLKRRFAKAPLSGRQA